MAKRFNMLLISLLGCLSIMLLMVYEVSDFKGIQINGFHSIIIALEFATSQVQLDMILASGKDIPTSIYAITNNTRLDFAFIAFYGLFLSSLIIYLFGTEGHLPRFLITLIIIACTSDVVENIAILDLVSSSSYLDLNGDAYFQMLSKATYMKWILLFVVLGYSFWLKLQHQFLSKMGKSWIFWILLMILLLSWVAFIITSIHVWVPYESRSRIIEVNILFNSLLLLILLLWPLSDLSRGIWMLFK